MRSRTRCSTLRRLQFHVVQVGFSDLRIRRPDLHRGQVAQNGHKSPCRLTRLPGVVGMFVQAEGVLVALFIRDRVALGEDRQGNRSARSFQDNIRGRWIRSRLTDELQAELQEAIIRSPLVAQESIGRHKVHVFTALRSNAHTLTVLIELQLHLQPRTLRIGGRPPFDVLVEARQHGHGSIRICTRTLGGVSVAEAGRASEAIVQVQVEVTGFAVPAMRALHVVLANADASVGITGRSIIERARGIAVARGAAVVAKVVEICVASVALLAGDSRFALALALPVALQRP